MCLRSLRFKNTLFSTYCTLLLLLYAPPFWNASIFTKRIVLRSEACSDWPAIQCIVIDRCDRTLTVLRCRVPARRHKNYKTYYKQGICCIQCGHNYWLWWLILSYTSRCITPHKHYHVCICDRRNNKQQALLYTAQNSCLNSPWQIIEVRKCTYRLWVRSSDCPYKAVITPLYRNSLCVSQRCSLLFQVQDTVLCKMHWTHSNIWGELFWNDVVNTT